jgi:nitrate reductase NapE component
MKKRKSPKSPPQVPDQPSDLVTAAPSVLVEAMKPNAVEVSEERLPVTPADAGTFDTRADAVADEGAAQPAESEGEAESGSIPLKEAGAEPGNGQRMTMQMKKILAQQVQVKVLGVAVVAGLMAMIWLYQQIPGPPPPPDKTVELALQAGLKEARAQVVEQQNNLKNLIGKVEVLSQELKQEREHTQARFQEVSSRLAEVIRQKLASPAPPAPAVASSQPVSTPEGVLQPTEALAELLLLKERNRLTDYADKAIATGGRDALQAVVEAMFDPEKQNLHHAAQAEFRRVQAFYEISASIDPAYKLPLLELFKDGSVKSEAEIKPAQLMALLKDARQPWEVRLRCAYLLRESPDKAVNAALLQALKEDASLDVAKQAQTSLERRLGKRFRLFDIPAVEAWMLAHPQN